MLVETEEGLVGRRCTSAALVVIFGGAMGLQYIGASTSRPEGITSCTDKNLQRSAGIVSRSWAFSLAQHE
jgi:hypothetical protein